MKLALILEDDESLAEMLKLTLQREGLRVAVAKNIKIAGNLLQNYRFDLAILDRLLPDGDGLELVKKIHQLSYQTMILMLTTQSGVSQRVQGLKAGADEYLGKPFSQQELVSRIKNLLSKQKIHRSEVISHRGITLFPKTCSLVVNGDWNKIRPRETQILACLLYHHGLVVTDEILLDFVWGGTGRTPSHRSISVYIRRLRMFLGEKADQLKTIRGVGYCLT